MYQTKHVFKQLETGEWEIRFYRLRSAPGILRLAQRFVNLGMRDDIPKLVYQMYMADKQRRLHGIPNEDRTTSRIPTLDTYKFELDRLKLNTKSSLPLILEREINTKMGAALHAVKYDESQRILKHCENWHKKQKKINLSDEYLIAVGGHDPDSKLGYDFIPYQIQRDRTKPLLEDPNFIVIDVPTWHMRNPVEQYDLRLPHHLLVVPEVDDAIRTNINLNGLKVILREIETGRLYHPGSGSIHTIPDAKDPSFNILNETAWNAYKKSGLNPEKMKFSVLGIENLYPVAATRAVDPSCQSVKISQLLFDAMVYPEYSAMGNVPITAHLVPLAYCPQELQTGRKIRLREMFGATFAHIDGESGIDTGHTYETMLRHVIGIDESGHKTGITLQEFFEKAQSGDIPEKIIQGAGFMNARHMQTRLGEWVTKMWKGDPMQQEILVLHFDQVNKAYIKSGRDESKNSWAMFNMSAAPTASFKYGDKPVPPYAYRPI